MKKQLPWLIACEESGTVRDAFLRKGIPAISCDLIPSRSDYGTHLQCDVLEAIKKYKWHGIIAFPPCTYMTLSSAWAFKDPNFEKWPGVGYHQNVDNVVTGKKRRKLRNKAVKFFLALYNCGLPRIVIENPIGFIPKLTGVKYQQVVQPYQFGEDASKSTCLWIKGLPLLKHTKYVEPAYYVNGKPRWSNQTISGHNNLIGNKHRARDRSKTWPGIAKAMAKQWGKY